MSLIGARSGCYVQHAPVVGCLAAQFRFGEVRLFLSAFVGPAPVGGCSGHWRPQGGGGSATGVMAPPLAREGGAIFSFGPTFGVKRKR